MQLEWNIVTVLCGLLSCSVSEMFHQSTPGPLTLILLLWPVNLLVSRGRFLLCPRPEPIFKKFPIKWSFVTNSQYQQYIHIFFRNFAPLNTISLACPCPSHTACNQNSFTTYRAWGLINIWRQCNQTGLIDYRIWCNFVLMEENRTKSNGLLK